MRLRTMQAIAVVLILAFWSGPIPAGAEREEAVKDVLKAYEEAWSRHDGEAVASFYLSPGHARRKGGPVVRATRAEQKAFFDGFLRGLVTVVMLEAPGKSSRSGCLTRRRHSRAASPFAIEATVLCSSVSP